MVTKSFVPCWKSSELEGRRAVGSQEDGMAGERRVCLSCRTGKGLGWTRCRSVLLAAATAAPGSWWWK